MGAGRPLYNASRQKIAKIYPIRDKEDMVRIVFHSRYEQKSKTLTLDEFDEYKRATGYMEEFELGQMSIFDY